MFNWIYSRLPLERKNEIEKRTWLGSFEGYVSIVINIIISLIKGFLAFLFNSVGLMADAVHSLSDVISSVLVIAGFRISAKPPDSEHPFGHGRVELIVSIIISTLLLVVGFEFFKDAIVRFRNPVSLSVSVPGMVVVVATLVVKEVLARFSFYLGEKINSKALMAEGHHHRSDAVSTVIIVISLVFVKYGIYWVDSVAGMIVSGFIIYSAIELLKDSSNPLLGTRTSQHDLEKITSIVMKHPKAIGVHDIIVHDFGNFYNISVHLELEDSISLCDAHRYSDEIEKDIQNEFPGFAVVHIDPVDKNNPKINEVSDYLFQISEELPLLKSIHNLRLVGDEKEFNVVFDVVENKNDNQYCLKKIDKKVKEKYPFADVAITFKRDVHHDKQDVEPV